MPKFAQNAKKMKIEREDLTIYYDMQCPYIYQKIEMVKQYFLPERKQSRSSCRSVD